MKSNNRICAWALVGTFLVSPVAAADQAVVTRINPDTMPGSLKFGYSQVVTVEAGAKLVFVAGQVGYSPDGPNDFRSQVDRSFENLRAGLDAAGATAQDVVRITLLIKDHDPGKTGLCGREAASVFCRGSSFERFDSGNAPLRR